MDIANAIKRPFSDMTKFIIGAILNILPIINFFSAGYVIRVANASIKKDIKSMPEWNDFGDLFVKGLLGFLILMIWLIPALIIVGIIGGTALISAFSGSFDLALIAELGTALLIGAILFIIIGYFVPLAILSYADKDKFSAGFDVSKIVKKAFTPEYFVRWLISIFIMMVFTVIAGLIPKLSIVLTPIASFASMIIMFTLIGEVYNKI